MSANPTIVFTQRDLLLLNKVGVATIRLVDNVGTLEDLQTVIKYHLVSAAFDALGIVVGLTKELDKIHKTLTTLYGRQHLLTAMPPDDKKNLCLLNELLRFQLPSATDEDLTRAKAMAKVIL